MNDVWRVVHEERRALASDLDGLDDQLWLTPSWCAGWTVHDVLAHLVDTATMTPWLFLKDMARARFDFDRANEFGVARAKADDPRVTLARLRTSAARTSSPPAPLETRLIEAFVHGEDIRRPLGITRGYPVDAVGRALRSQATTSAALGGGKALVAGLTLSATDCAETLGSGPVVEGPVISLLLAASGRRQASADLSGLGLAVLRERLAC